MQGGSYSLRGNFCLSILGYWISLLKQNGSTSQFNDLLRRNSNDESQTEEDENIG